MPRHRRPIPPVPSHLVLPPDDGSRGYVYFVLDPTNGLIKIGKSFRPRLMIRMREIEKELGYPVEILAVIDGARHTERDLHRRFASIRSHREWFHPTAELRELIAQSNMSAAALAYWGEWLDLLAPTSAPARQDSGRVAGRVA